jgi:uncharacterized protein (TIGR02996 family)
MSQDEAFIQNILAYPDDPGLRLIYADWLDEQNDPRGAFLRLEAEVAALPEKDRKREALTARLRELSAELPRHWLVRLDRTPIDNCASLGWEFECPKRWEELKETDDPGVRFCDACRKKVFHCRTVSDAYSHALKGRCVALDSRNERSTGNIFLRMAMVGQPAHPTTGDPVTIVEGTHRGYSGRLEEFDRKHGRATVRIMMGNRSVLVVVNRDDVEFP